jgi:hypothetical protein
MPPCLTRNERRAAPRKDYEVLSVCGRMAKANIEER